ncbi:MAG: bifunctional 2-polyprenyl-6-hydroxyphenol methylase/3-demethylubiquinol 3-O-methyltransferase UbiG, partial [Rhizomicrobium sp.]
WWDPRGKFAPLHKFNPVRLRFIREQALARFRRRAQALVPFENLSLLDIGCGGGLLAEPMARLGFAVTGLDASEKNIDIARAHADREGLALNYQVGTAESLAEAGKSFDVVLSMEVVEHVADVKVYIGACARLVKAGGIIITATLNRSFKSLLLAKFAAEYVLQWLPPGTHDWRRFQTPPELQNELKEAGLSILETQGIAFDVFTWDWRLSKDVGVNYMVVAER